MEIKMTKISIVLAFCTLLSMQSNAQVGIGAASPDNSAMLEVKSNTRGLLTPRMTETERTAIGTPAQGLIVYQTDGSAGFYYYDGGWIKLLSNTDDLDASKLASGTVPTARLGSGTADGTTYLRGDGQWAPAAGGSSFPKLIVSAYMTSAYNITSAASTTTYKIPLNAETVDVNNEFNTTTNTFTAANAGKYEVTTMITWGTVGNGLRMQKLMVNGSTGPVVTMTANATVTHATFNSIVVTLAAGETLTLEGGAYSTTTPAFTVSPVTGQYNTYMQIKRLE